MRAHRSTRDTKGACVNPKKRLNEGSGGAENIPNWALSLVPGIELKISTKSRDYLRHHPDKIFLTPVMHLVRSSSAPDLVQYSDVVMKIGSLRGFLRKKVTPMNFF